MPLSPHCAATLSSQTVKKSYGAKSTAALLLLPFLHLLKLLNLDHFYGFFFILKYVFVDLFYTAP